MKFCLVYRGSALTLVERANVEGSLVLRRVSADYARTWVRQGRDHETGFYVRHDGQVVYARADRDAA